MDWKRETLTGSESWLLMLPGDRLQLAKMPSWARLGSRVPVRSIRHQQRPQTIVAPFRTENYFSRTATNAIPGNIRTSIFLLAVAFFGDFIQASFLLQTTNSSTWVSYGV